MYSTSREKGYTMNAKTRYYTQDRATQALKDQGFRYLGVANGIDLSQHVDYDNRNTWTAWSGRTSRIDADLVSKTFWTVWES